MVIQEAKANDCYFCGGKNFICTDPISGGWVIRCGSCQNVVRRDIQGTFKTPEAAAQFYNEAKVEDDGSRDSQSA